MQFTPFPGCCTAKILIGFGQTNAADHASIYAYGMHRHLTFEQKLSWLKEHLLMFAETKSIAIIFATTTTQQIEGISLLTQAGFTQTVQADKQAHRESKLIGWHYIIAPVEAPAPVNVFVPKQNPPPVAPVQVARQLPAWERKIREFVDGPGVGGSYGIFIMISRNPNGHILDVPVKIRKSVVSGFALIRHQDNPLSTTEALKEILPAGRIIMIRSVSDQDRYQGRVDQIPERFADKNIRFKLI